MKWLIIFATPREAAVTIQMLAATKITDARYAFPEGEILLCGMGLEAAAQSVSVAPIHGYQWLNIGLAGSIDSRLSVGTSCLVGSVGLLYRDGSGCLLAQEDPLLLDPCGASFLYSSPIPVYAAPKVDPHCALVDMEGYAITRAAREKGAPLIMRKVVSDHCTQTSHTDILSNIDWLSRRMADEVVNTLLQASSPRVSSL
jgi:nucleoside phosphorylase